MIDINIDPILFRWDPLVITWHGFFTAVGVLCGIWLATRLSIERGFTEDDIMSVALWCVVGGIVGARLMHVVDQWPYYAQDPIAILRVNEGGLAVWGMIIGGPIGGAIYAKWRGFSIPRLLDLGGMGMILGMAIGRLGDVINGEHHGADASVPWSVRYTHPNTLGDLNVPVHLAVGYELFWDIIVLGFCMWLLYRRALPRDGMVFWTMIALYSLGRFFVQFFRLDTPFLWGLSQAQLLSFAVGAIAVWILVYQAAGTRRGRLDDDDLDEDEAAPATPQPEGRPTALAGADDGRATKDG
jgi:phosphatidylglycerol:prolipoprotein diacylglycerol transferase